MSATINVKDRVFVPIIVVLSAVIPVAVAVLFYMPEAWREYFVNENFRGLPLLHAVLNGSTAVLLLTGLYFIKNKNIIWHRASMVAAFVFSAIFLVSYVIAKVSTPPVPYGGEGIMRGLYFFVLVSHIILSVPVLPLAMFSIYRGFTGQFEKHKKITRWAFPIWLYVAITGVLVYLFMQPYY